MEITTIRIDDRLIHGQIVTKWIDYAEARQILVVDERSAADPMLKMILGLAVPSGIHLEVLSMKAALDFLRDDLSTTKTLMILRSPKTLLDFIHTGYDGSQQEIILGNMSYDEKKIGVRHVLDYLYVNDQDLALLRELSELTKRITIKAVPEEKGKEVREWLLK